MGYGAQFFFRDGAVVLDARSAQELAGPALNLSAAAVLVVVAAGLVFGFRLGVWAVRGDEHARNHTDSRTTGNVARGSRVPKPRRSHVPRGPAPDPGDHGQAPTLAMVTGLHLAVQWHGMPGCLQCRPHRRPASAPPASLAGLRHRARARRQAGHRAHGRVAPVQP